MQVNKIMLDYNLKCNIESIFKRHWKLLTGDVSHGIYIRKPYHFCQTKRKA